MTIDNIFTRGGGGGGVKQNFEIFRYFWATFFPPPPGESPTAPNAAAECLFCFIFKHMYFKDYKKFIVGRSHLSKKAYFWTSYLLNINNNNVMLFTLYKGHGCIWLRGSGFAFLSAWGLVEYRRLFLGLDSSYRLHPGKKKSALLTKFPNSSNLSSPEMDGGRGLFLRNAFLFASVFIFFV